MKSGSVSIFRALGNATRLDIVLYLMEKKEACCQEIAERFTLSQPTLSHHFAKLSSAGVICVRRQGQMHICSVNKEAIKKAGIDEKLLKKLSVKA